MAAHSRASAPFHYDVEAAIAKMRATMANTSEKMLAGDLSAEQRQFVDLQNQFYEMAILSTRTCLTALNDEVPRIKIAAALGLTMGTILSQFIGSSKDHPEACMMLVSQMNGALDHFLAGGSLGEGAMSTQERIQPTHGGHA